MPRRVRGFPHGQAGEITQLDEVGGEGVDGSQLVKYVVNGEYLLRGIGLGHLRSVELLMDNRSSTLHRCSTSRPFHQDSTHGFRRGTEKWMRLFHTAG